MNIFTPAIQMIFFVTLTVSLLLVLYRLLKGPHVLDRIMCVDAMAMVVLGMMVVWELAVGTKYFFDALLILSIVGFISTVALAKFLDNGDIIE